MGNKWCVVFFILLNKPAGCRPAFLLFRDNEFQDNEFNTLFWAKYIWDIWDKVFKNGLSKICGRQSLKNFEGIWSTLGRLFPFKFFKGFLPQILFGPFLNTLSHIYQHTVSDYLLDINSLLQYNKVIENRKPMTP